MKVREIFDRVLVELNKIKAPALKLFEFNYFLNKAILQYVNRQYNIYDVSLLTTDDLLALKAFKEYTLIENNSVVLPEDYLHLLNCICEFENTNSKCNKHVIVPATKVTADAWGNILQDVYNKPSIRRPYFDLSQSKCEIRFGDNPNVKLLKIKMEYVKTPQKYKLTQKQLDSVEDKSQDLEFSEYVIQEIINGLVLLLMEHSMDPRVQTNALINLSIASPIGQLQQ